MTCPFNNLAQCPVISVPSGFTKSGLPTAVQIVGHRFADREILQIASALEPVIKWHEWQTPL